MGYEKTGRNPEIFTREKLEEILVKHNILVSEWGKGVAKTIDHLLNELNSGEALLSETEKGELIREIFAVSVNVYFKDIENKKKLFLMEDKQVFKDGRERSRSFEVKDCSIAEKVKPGEDLRLAATRSIQEELGIESGFSLEMKKELQKLRDSNSYPGLKSKYNLYYFDAELFPDQFNKDGYVEEQKDKSTFFVWKEV